MTNIMKGAKTYTGLVVTLLGLVGIGEYFSPGQTGQLADIIVQIVGLAFAAYGRKVAKLA